MSIRHHVQHSRWIDAWRRWLPSVCCPLSSSLDPSARDSRTKCVTNGCQESRILIRDYGGPKATKRCNAHRAESGKRANCADDIDQCLGLRRSGTPLAWRLKYSKAVIMHTVRVHQLSSGRTGCRPVQTSE